MANMFDKKTEFGGAFQANEMVLTFAGFGAGYLITGVNANYSVQVTRLRELGSTRTYYVEGDSQGTVGLQRVTGPSSSITALVRAYSDVCSLPQNIISLSFAPGQCSAGADGEAGITFEGVLFNQYGLTATSTAQMVAQTTLSGTFEELSTGEDEGKLSSALNTASNAAAAVGL